MSVNPRLANFAERVAWTGLQAATADGVLALWEGPITHHPQADRALWLVILTTVLAAVKNSAAQAFGSPTGATLPSSVAQPTASATVEKASPTGEVAGVASTVAEPGTPVETVSVDSAATEAPAPVDDRPIVTNTGTSTDPTA